MNAAQEYLPRQFQVGPLILDLLHRDARYRSHWLALHPREFELLWRLGEACGGRVSRATLLRDVWRLSHIPETNSLEVHIHRLRTKLDLQGLAGLVVTDEAGGYRIAANQTGANAGDGNGKGSLILDPHAKVHAGKSALDSHVMVGEVTAKSKEDQHDISDQ